MSELARTVVVPSVGLTGKKLAVFKELEELYRQVLVELVDYGSRNNIDSFTRLKRDKYRELRGRHPHLPSHYIHTACQDASTRIKSFNKLKRRGLAKSERPEVSRVSIWLDDHLWKRVGYTTILIYTHKGWMPVELVPHKLYWRYVNSGWALRTQPKIRIDYRRRRLLVYFVFAKAVDVDENSVKRVISVDVNEDNVAVKVLNRVFILETGVKRITIGYARYREAVQSVKGNGYVGRAIHGRERKRKRDIRSKIANIVSNTAKSLNAVVVLEELPKQCPRNMIRDVRDPALRHRIYQAGFRGMVKAIEEKCLERGVLVVKVDPRDTSSTCPFCNSKLVRGNAPRQLKCPRCGFRAGRDVVAVLNLEKKYLTPKGLVPLTPMPSDPTPEVAVLPVKKWARRKSLEGTTKHPETPTNTLQGQTVFH
ncbi:RNA-guided endonuclease InsQ/TnpB family protein [Thermosphaera aggregans]|uniref:Transposase, IS605 OrfB family n=1 Tax=Thermosphaera aggregans (strain DSM 11486 / M11TL) TaxID=633148 RepID=D5U1P6_THEAM|nr:RNA-guided endonuclease TnpB family protein [Thermosphaera aggregans]ADG91046.1 transposase, IS605 OrfB family [Thermosphaera aggregans DSM 11486]